MKLEIVDFIIDIAGLISWDELDIKVVNFGVDGVSVFQGMRKG